MLPLPLSWKRSAYFEVPSPPDRSTAEPAHTRTSGESSVPRRPAAVRSAARRPPAPPPPPPPPPPHQALQRVANVHKIERLEMGLNRLVLERQGLERVA